MADNSPDGLDLSPKNRLSFLNIARMSKGPLYIGIFGALIMFAILVYSVNFAHNPDEEQAKAKEVDIQESEKPLLMGEGKGLALLPPTNSPAILQPPVPKADENSGREPLIVVRGESDQSNESRQELENLRRMRSQALLTALAAPLGAKKPSGGQTQVLPAAGEQSEGTGRSAAASSGLDASALAQGDYNPAADKDKEAFFSRAGKDAAWILPDTRTPGQRFELKTGAVIPGVMVTGINSDLPGQIIAQVSQNVFDTATGRHLLVPQGAKLFGVYDSRVVYGQERVLVAWNRLMFPDGSSISLGAMPGADMGGFAGYTDEVDNHYLRVFGSAVLMSLITGGMSYSMDSMSPGGDSDKPTLQDEMGSALAAQMGQTTLTLLQKNLNIKPTLAIRPGYQFNLIVTKDMVFEKPYKAQK